MWTDDEAVVAGHNVLPDRWRAMFEGLMDRISGRFTRVEPRARARQSMLGLLADLPCKNCWTIAEHTGDSSPDGLQHLLGRAKWDAALAHAPRPHPGSPQRADHLAKRIPRRAWQKLSAGRGAKGHRWYDSAQLALTGADLAGHQHLLIRRNRRTGELACHRCYSPRPVPLSTLVQVAGSRWTIEETLQSSKTLAGLDEHKVRRWDSWHRWVTLALLAHAFLAVTAALERRNQAPPGDGTSAYGLIPLTCNEIQRLFTAVIARPVRDLAHRLRWSTWRRRHLARAQRSHYRRQAALHP